MNPETLNKVYKFITARSILSLATVNPAGQPEAAALLYAVDDETLIWASGPRSRHSRNISEQGRAAITIHNEAWSWNEIAGVQMEGEVNLIPAGPARERAWAVYKAKFPSAAEFEDDLATSEFYRFAPTWIRFIDHTVYFGYQEESTPR